jgi:hypothetical protein
MTTGAGTGTGTASSGGGAAAALGSAHSISETTSGASLGSDRCQSGHARPDSPRHFHDSVAQNALRLFRISRLLLAFGFLGNGNPRVRYFQ